MCIRDSLYSVPILLNGEAYNLQVAYDFTAEEWSILGASQGLDESGMASNCLLYTSTLRKGEFL